MEEESELKNESDSRNALQEPEPEPADEPVVEPPPAEEQEDVDPRDNLTKEQIDYWKSIFDQFDPQKKLKVPVKTIGYVLRLMGFNPTKVEIKKHIQEVDPFNKGMVDFQSFLLPIAQKINDEPETYEQIIAAFKVFDEENGDFVYTDQLIDYLTSLGEDLEDFELDALVKTADPKGLNKIYYVEFVEKLYGIVRNPKAKGKKDKKKKK